jgi:hypothetical protein
MEMEDGGGWRCHAPPGWGAALGRGRPPAVGQCYGIWNMGYGIYVICCMESGIRNHGTWSAEQLELEHWSTACCVLRGDNGVRGARSGGGGLKKRRASKGEGRRANGAGYCADTDTGLHRPGAAPGDVATSPCSWALGIGQPLSLWAIAIGNCMCIAIATATTPTPHPPTPSTGANRQCCKWAWTGGACFFDPAAPRPRCGNTGARAPASFNFCGSSYSIGGPRV